MPAPPRITSLFTNLSGDHAKPICGPRLFQSDRVTLLTVTIFESISPLGPSCKLPSWSAWIGSKYSQRKPKLRLKFGITFQSRCPKKAMSELLNAALLACGLPFASALIASKIGVSLAKFHGRTKEYNGRAPPVP